jgi:hypothetical protein
MGERDYFVRIGAPVPAPEPRHRRRRVHVPIGVVVIVFLAAWMLWAQSHAGGARAQIEHAIEKARGAVEHATTDPGLKRAAIYFNAQYERDGRYTSLSDAERGTDPAADWGVGVTVELCSPQVMVLRSLTGAGTVSRLLLSGRDLGDAIGEHACPSDYANPKPWTTQPPARP